MAVVAAAAEEVLFDVFEEILKRLDAKDLIKCKSICQSWKSFISNPCFVKAHMKHSYNNDYCNPAFVHRRIGFVKTPNTELKAVVGSYNGLVCYSSYTTYDYEFVVVNPCTREVNKTATFRHLLDNKWKQVCRGFGYDSSADDYKVIAGFTPEEEKQRILFYALTLKSNVWKLVGELKYYRLHRFGENGIFYGGALHWFMYTNKRIKIISLDLSSEEFKEIPQPSHEDYAPPAGCQCYYEEHHYCQHVLGVVEECLSIFKICSTTSNDIIWVMKNNNKWETHDFWFRTNDVGEYWVRSKDVQHIILHESDGYTLLGGRELDTCAVIHDSIFVQSLVSPHPCVKNNDNYYEGQTMGIAKTGTKRKNKKRRKRSCKRKTTLFNKLLTWKSSFYLWFTEKIYLNPTFFRPYHYLFAYE